MRENRIAIAASSSQQDIAEALAATLNLPVVTDEKHNEYNYLIIATPEYTGLIKPADPAFKPFYIDFLAGKMRYRRDHAGLKRELIARAMGCKPGSHPRIIDATAGLGRDSFILASLGFTVTMLERSKVLYVLLQDALTRAARDPQTAPIVARLQLIQADAISWLSHLKGNEKPGIIYLDPMFPERQKSASIKKEMAICQDLLGKDEDADVLFQAAFSCAIQRVVVKRPRLAVNIANHAPNFSLTGKSSRFDVYLTQQVT